MRGTRGGSTLFLLIALSGCGTARSAVETPVVPRAAPPPISKAPEFGHPAPELSEGGALRLWATWYSVPVVHAAGSGGVALLDRSGRALGPRVSPRDFCDGALQGTLRVVEGDGRATTYDFAGLAQGPSVDCSRWYPAYGAIGRARFRASSAVLGRGAHGGAPVPYRTIAVDPRHIPKGSLVYIPAARGVPIVLPSGERVTHDGWFYAADTGGGVRGNHIDLFLGFSKTNPFPFATGSKRATFPAYLVEDDDVAESLAALHAQRPSARR